MHKFILSVLNCISFIPFSFGQQELEKLQVSFNDFKRYNVAEKIYTHTDKELYVSGEIVWFKLYVLNADNNKPLDLSKLAYVEILNADQKPVLQTKVALENGSGNGSLYLPSSINSGVYKFRAYTNWMKNFSADYYFEKPLTIVNTLKTPGSSSSPRRSFDVTFFPEGGSLVQGLESRVAFKITNESGSGIDGNGFLLKNDRDTITRFQTLKYGMGRFAFTPERGNSYRVFIRLADTIITGEFPKPLEEGYVLKVDNDQKMHLKLVISTKILSAGFVYLFVHTRHNITLAEKILLKDGVAGYDIDKTKLQEGISHITVFNAEMQPVCERLFFTPPRQKIILQPAVEKYQFNSRKQVKLTINCADESGSAVPADLSVSVYRCDDVDSIQTSMIDNYVWLSSELRGRIESPGYYLSEAKEVEEARDNLMLTHGWRRFTWQNIIQQRKPAFSFIPEYRGHTVYGKVIDKTTGTPARAIATYFSIPGYRIQLYGSLSDSSGIISFYTKDLYGPNEVILQTYAGPNNKYRLEISSPFSDQYSQNRLPAFHLPDSMRNLLTDYSISMQVQNNFNGNNLKRVYRPVADSTPFYGRADKQYLLDEYTRFATMEEVLREYVYEILVRRQREDFRLIMADGANRIFLDDPLTLLNGVPVLDPNKIMKYDPLKVRRIDVVKSKYFSGPLVLNGIVNFITYEPDPSLLSDLDGVIIEYEGMQFQREFYSPSYENDEQLLSRTPDFRNVLFWSPEIYTDDKGNASIDFFTSDMKGKYIVVWQGMDSTGRVGKMTTSFEVK